MISIQARIYAKGNDGEEIFLGEYDVRFDTDETEKAVTSTLYWEQEIIKQFIRFEYDEPVSPRWL
jgi:hypothetical protein